jgi:hypothetical protein
MFFLHPLRNSPAMEDQVVTRNSNDLYSAANALAWASENFPETALIPSGIANIMRMFETVRRKRSERVNNGDDLTGPFEGTCHLSGGPSLIDIEHSLMGSPDEFRKPLTFHGTVGVMSNDVDVTIRPDFADRSYCGMYKFPLWMIGGWLMGCNDKKLEQSGAKRNAETYVLISQYNAQAREGSLFVTPFLGDLFNKDIEA